MKNSTYTSVDQTSDERNATTYILRKIIISLFFKHNVTDVVTFKCNFLLKYSTRFRLLLISCAFSLRPCTVTVIGLMAVVPAHK